MRRRRAGPIMAKRGGKRRDPARERFWRQAIRRQQRGGLSVRDFCLHEGLKVGAFCWWRQELARRDRQAEVTSRCEQEDRSAEPAPAFLPVRVVDPGAIPPRQAPAIEILLPTGPTVRVPSGFD